MKLFDVYPLFNITPVKAEGCTVWDENGQEYLDLYGGHAVISIGHSHPKYIAAITEQLNKIGFYSNSVLNPLQVELAQKLGQASGLNDYALFLSNSGAEANENALKLASFHTGRSKVVAFKGSFHGRTSGAVAVTCNPKIVSPFNANHEVEFAELNNIASVEALLRGNDVAAVIIEGIQGVSGIHTPTPEFLEQLSALCEKHGTVLILDEIQSGYGRSGKFFVFQHSSIKPDIVTTAKGMANGFPIGGCLISPKFEATYGMLGTTFGGNYLAMVAAIAVLDVFEEEKLVENAKNIGQYILENLPQSPKIKEVRGMGMMIGIEFNEPIKELRSKMLFEEHIFTGVAGTNTLRLLSPLSLTKEQATRFIDTLKKLLN